MEIVLASKSPRRKELFEKFNLPFKIITKDTPEIIDEKLSLEEAIKQVALMKALAVHDEHESELIVSADTIVTLDHKVYGKPKNNEDAERMLSELSGRTHEVITGVALVYQKQQVLFASISEVTFYSLSEDEIKAYVASKEPLDKAGAYGIQGLGAMLVEKINGDYFSIMGLPVAKLKREIDKILKTNIE